MYATFRVSRSVLAEAIIATKNCRVAGNMVSVQQSGFDASSRHLFIHLDHQRARLAVDKAPVAVLC